MPLPADGTFRIDDVQIKPASFLNVVRRGDTAVKVTLAGDGSLFREGKDYSPIVDPKCGNVRWKGDFSDRHEGPAVKILPGSRIREGDWVNVDYYHAAMVLKGVCICLNSPKLKPLIERQIRWFQEAIRPEGMLIGIDEQRSYGYDPACVKSGIDAGTALRSAAIFTRNKIREIALQQARTRAHAVNCISNLKQIGAALQTYADHHSGYMIHTAKTITYDGATCYYWQDLPVLMKLIPFYKRTLSATAPKGVLACPGENNRTLLTYNEWDSRKGSHCGMNYFAYSKHNTWGTADSDVQYRRFARIWQPSKAYYVTDAGLGFDSGTGANRMPHSYVRGGYNTISLRHSGKFNVVHFDGHAGSFDKCPLPGAGYDWRHVVWALEPEPWI